MTPRPYQPPSLSETAFNCPHCSAFATQKWARAVAEPVREGLAPTNPLAIAEAVGVGRADKPHSFGPSTVVKDHWFAFCERCGMESAWLGDRMIYPDAGGGAPPNPDLPDGIHADYLEAQGIVGRSPRGAAALLRLCIQKLCRHLGEKGKDLNTDIASLVRKGLPTEVQQALDAVRVIGNEAVHPGQMDLTDDRQTADTLFKLVNLVTQRMISDPKEVQEVYEGLPQSARDAINKRGQGKP
jgi:Domain of unknown function (DUF4145)